MDDNEVSTNPEEQDSQHAERVTGAFRSLEQKLGERFTEEEQRLRGIREAALKRDRREVEKHLATTKRESSWLYDELMKHPDVSAIIRELSIMGF